MHDYSTPGMVSHGKRPRSIEKTHPIQDRILSAFVNDPPSPSGSGKPKKKRRSGADSANAVIANDIEDLHCISKESGPELLSLVETAILTSVKRDDHLGRQLFSHGQVDFMPPLCVIVALVSKSHIQLADLDAKLLLRRAIYELQSTETCSCRGKNRGVAKMLRMAVAIGRSDVRDSLVHVFLSVLFQDDSIQSSAEDKVRRLQLARSLLLILCDQNTAEQETKEVFVNWVRRAVLPTREMDAAVDDPSLSIVRVPKGLNFPQGARARLKLFKGLFQTTDCVR